MSVDQFEEANQKWKYSNERTSEIWRKVEATAVWDQANLVPRVLSYSAPVAPLGPSRRGPWERGWDQACKISSR